ncbi:hypothetical protein [Ligilactobacillus ruminis]|uniref:hypothetical protein n=1 Tax=Ligilactobacillus ruminis TaxID=1623 RepID=UPI003CFD7A78
MKQSRRIDGTFFATAMILFVLIASVFCIKTTICRERIHDYQEQASYYEARAMAKMALSNEIKHKQIFRFNTGNVSRNYLKLTVELNDKKTYQFSVPTRFANFKK